MPRSLMLGNGSLLATFDARLQLRDLYFPYVGKEDHTTFGKVHRVGAFVEGKGFAWFDDPSWTIQPGYKLETLVGQSKLHNDHLGIAIDLEDAVHPVHNMLIRRFTVRSLDQEKKIVKLFFNHDLYIYGDKQKDTAFYEPYTNSVIHYRDQRYFLIGGDTTAPEECVVGHRGGAYDSVLHSKTKLQSCGISAFTVGKSNYRGLEGTWRDAEDGVLSGHPIEQGSVDSTVGIYSIVEPGKETTVTLWLCVGTSLEDVIGLQERVTEDTPERLVRNATNYWKSWVNKKRIDFGSLDARTVELYKRSLLQVRLHSDNNGGILAAADADIMAFNRDTYTYVWPRDGAFICTALDKAGYGEISHRFFEFCIRAQTPDGYMLHKYNPDGSVGSSWHAWYKNGESQLPIQEDETALVLYAMQKHFEQDQDFEFLQRLYESFVRKAAEFLCNFREDGTGLPLPSYDPWEEQRGIFTYTVATTIAGLHAAAQMAQMLGHHAHSERYHHVADEMKQALFFHLYDEKEGRFLKKIVRKDGKTLERDNTPDASITAVWKLGVLPVEDPRVVSTMDALDRMLTVNTPIGGWARYTNDTYHYPGTPTPEATGNPWIITTLWKAQWVIARARNKEDLAQARALMDWVVKSATTTGILAEQLHCYTGEPLSVAPLTWSHATFVETVLLYVEKEAKLNAR